jgi:hypothetical protein
MKKCRKFKSEKITEKTGKSKKPEFKPGNKPYLEYDGCILNANVPWIAIVRELMECGVTENEIADYAECPLETIADILENNYETLSFRAGARMLTLHSNHFPICYAN